MTRDEKIDSYLQFYSTCSAYVDIEHGYSNFYYRNQEETKPTEYNEQLIEMDLILSKMIQENLVETDEFNARKIKISIRGEEILESGGWLNHKEQNKKERDFENEERQLQVDLAKSNIEANRINKKNQKRNFVILIIGLIMTAAGVAISIINLLDKAQK